MLWYVGRSNFEAGLRRNYTMENFRKGSGDPKSLDDTYFALDAFNKLDDREIFVDCGAYIGDTLKDYVYRRKGTFKR